MSGFGGLVAFVPRGGLPAAERFLDVLRLMARAVSLGGVETLVSLPVYSSHHMCTEEQLAADHPADGPEVVLQDPADEDEQHRVVGDALHDLREQSHELLRRG